MRVFLFGLCCLVCWSCFDQGDCLIISTNQVSIALKSLKKRDSAVSLQFDQILIPERANFDVTEKFSAFRLPLDPTASETTFVFKYMGVSDTLVLGYSKQTKVLSSDCGSYLYFDDLRILYTTFAENEITIADSKLLTTVAPNIEIYY